MPRSFLSERNVSRETFSMLLSVLEFLFVVLLFKNRRMREECVRSSVYWNCCEKGCRVHFLV